jgi:cyanate permease
MLGIAGLVSALTGDGWRDALSWLALAAPVAALIWAMRTRRL